MNKIVTPKTDKLSMQGLLKVSGKRLLSLGEKLREEDRHEEAIVYLSLAIAHFQKKHDFGGMIDALKGRALTWKHYYLLTKNTSYAILAKKDSEAMLEIAEEKELKNKLSTSYFRLGETNMLFRDYSSAIKNYQKSLAHFSGIRAEKGDFRYHLGEAVYESGRKKKGEEIMLAGLQEIQKNRRGVDPFLIHVWETGCYGRLAYLLRKDNPQKAKEYLSKAKKIADADPKLIIRRRQIKQLSGLL